MPGNAGTGVTSPSAPRLTPGVVSFASEGGDVSRTIGGRGGGTVSLLGSTASPNRPGAGRGAGGPLRPPAGGGSPSSVLWRAPDGATDGGPARSPCGGPGGAPGGADIGIEGGGGGALAPGGGKGGIPRIDGGGPLVPGFFLTNSSKTSRSEAPLSPIRQSPGGRCAPTESRATEQ